MSNMLYHNTQHNEKNEEFNLVETGRKAQGCKTIPESF